MDAAERHRVLPGGDLPAPASWAAMTRPSVEGTVAARRPPCWRAKCRIGGHPHERFNLRADLLGGQRPQFLDQREEPTSRGPPAMLRQPRCFTSTAASRLHLAGKSKTSGPWTSSGPAFATARHTPKANGIGNIHFQEADVFELLAGFAAARRQFPSWCWTRRRCRVPPQPGSGGDRLSEIICALAAAGAGGFLVLLLSHPLGERCLELNCASLTRRRPTVRCWSAARGRRTTPSAHGSRTHYLKCLILEVGRGRACRPVSSPKGAR